MTEDILDRLAKSKFRSSFRLSKKYRDYAAEKGAETIRHHAEDFIAARLGTRGYCKRRAPNADEKPSGVYCPACHGDLLPRLL